MNMQKYQLLLTVVDMGSITRAAEHLNYTQSAVSQALLSLEREWGFQLLERSRTGVGLTPNAQAILPYLREICNSQQALEGAVSSIAGIQTGLIRIGAITSLSCQWLPPALKQFHLLHPGVRFDLRQGGYTDIEQLLGSGEIDVGFSVFRSLKQWDAFPLGEDRMLAVLPRDHKLAQFEQVPLKLLGEEPFILLEEGGYSHAELLFRSAGVRPNIALHIHDDSRVMALVENGLGVSMLSELVLRRCPYRVSIRELDQTAHRKLSAARRRDRNPAPAVKCFFEFIKECRLAAMGLTLV